MIQKKKTKSKKGDASRKSKSANQKKKASQADESTNGISEPEITIVERGMFDLKDTIHTREVETKRPKELVCRISLPKINSAANVDLDVGNRYLTLEVKDVYFLERRLPYEVIGEKGSAKWIKKKNQLVVTIPVKPPPKKPVKKFTEPKVQDAEDFAEESSSPLVSEVVSSPKSVTENAISEVEKDEKEERGEENSESPETNLEDTNQSNDAVSEIPGLSPEMQKKLREARAAYDAWQEQGDKKHQEEEKRRQEEEKIQQEKAMAALALKSANGDAEKAAKQKKFIPSANFDGRREFYVFKNGEEGLGYYWDTFGIMGRLPVSSDFNDVTSGNEKSASQTKVVKKDDDSKEGDLLKLPQYRFRQDKSCVTILVQVENIDPSSVIVDYKADRVHLKFLADGETYGFLLRPPEDAAVDPSKCRYDVSQSNMAMVVGKKSNKKWVLNVERVERNNPLFAKVDKDDEIRKQDEPDVDLRRQTGRSSASGGGGGAGHAPLSNKLFMELD